MLVGADYGPSVTQVAHTALFLAAFLLDQDQAAGGAPIVGVDGLEFVVDTLADGSEEGLDVG